jgi:hypothetical protein
MIKELRKSIIAQRNQTITNPAYRIIPSFLTDKGKPDRKRIKLVLYLSALVSVRKKIIIARISSRPLQIVNRKKKISIPNKII